MCLILVFVKQRCFFREARLILVFQARFEVLAFMYIMPHLLAAPVMIAHKKCVGFRLADSRTGN